MSCASSFVDCLPVLSILAIMVWSYYAYVVEFCIHTIENSLKASLYMIFYHMLYFMFLWTYFKVMCTGIAVVPVEYKVPEILYERIKAANTEDEKNNILLQFSNKRELVVITRNEEGFIRFCNKCKHVKPDRAHHCSTCKTCILKMDHHCPWINNCIGFSNYKYFLLMLCYTSLYCIYYAGTTLEYFIKFWGEPVKRYSSLHVIISFIVSLGLGIIVASFCCYHMLLISKNQTTLEVLKEPTFRDHNENLTFHIGTRQNFAEVFGETWWLWFFPLWSSYGDGLHYPVRLML